jgi:hypothetical protein
LFINVLISMCHDFSRGGRDSVDHAPFAQDDLINSAAWALTLAALIPEAINFHVPIVAHNPLSTYQPGLPHVLSPATATTFAKLIVDTAPATLEALCKQQIAGQDTGLQKHNYIEAIQKRGDILFSSIASPQARFAKAMTEDDTGKLLYAAAKAASGSEAASPGPDEPGDENFSGPAYAEMEVLAHDLQLANPNLSMQQAFSRSTRPQKIRT